MSTKKDNERLIDATDFDLRVSQKTMMDVFPNWKELPEDVQVAVCKHAQHLHMLLETQPTVDAAPVVHGRWMWEGRFKACSECGSYIDWNDTLGANHWSFCPYCGAKMDLED